MAKVIYIARDIERALGIIPEGDYYIITNKTPYSEEIKRIYPNNVFLTNEDRILDTIELMNLEGTVEIINRLRPYIVVFKNTQQIQELCKSNGWKLLNPSWKLSEKIENKISQVEWLDELISLLPKYEISDAANIVWLGKPIIIQWSHGHTGDGTIIVKDSRELENIKKKFPYRKCKVTEYIKGPMFTANIVVNEKSILVGNISYQITGILPFTENQFSTIGNDWSVTHTILTDKKIDEFSAIANKIGEKMRESGWKGLFGIDVILDEERDELYLIEINARQPASTTYESELQSKLRYKGINSITTFEAHMKALLNDDNSETLIYINDGAQIVQRKLNREIVINENVLIKDGYRLIKYNNSKTNSDLLRIQSDKGIMEAHNKFNKRGKEITEAISIQ